MPYIGAIVGCGGGGPPYAGTWLFGGAVVVGAALAVGVALGSALVVALGAVGSPAS